MEQRANHATRGPWQVKYGEIVHGPGSSLCVEHCGRGHLPVRINDDGTHICTGDWVEDVVGDQGAHVVCTGHDYDERGLVSSADAEFIAHAREDIPCLLATLTALRAALAQAQQEREIALAYPAAFVNEAIRHQRERAEQAEALLAQRPEMVELWEFQQLEAILLVLEHANPTLQMSYLETLEQVAFIARRLVDTLAHPQERKIRPAEGP